MNVLSVCPWICRKSRRDSVVHFHSANLIPKEPPPERGLSCFTTTMKTIQFEGSFLAFIATLRTRCVTHVCLFWSGRTAAYLTWNAMFGIYAASALCVVRWDAEDLPTNQDHLSFAREHRQPKCWVEVQVQLNRGVLRNLNS